MDHAPVGSISPARFPVEQWRLANGLRVIVQVDARCPLVASMMCYNAGSRHDPASRSGLAHFCEHLAFEVPSGRARGDPDGSRAITGGAFRAFSALRGAPRNALLVLVGDVSVPAAAELVRGTFEALPGGAERPCTAASDVPPPQGPRSLRVPAP